MTFQSIQLENFQSHEDTTLELDPGVNVIIGPSDSGKTAIVRALRWLTWNRPTGDAFRSSWGGDTIVTANLTEGMVRRVRTKSLNAYYVGDREYKAFGADVPSDVVEFMNLDSVNLQQQLDRPFLLDTHPGQVAQYLNEVAHLDVIDRALGKLTKWIRALEANIRTDESNQARLEESQSSFDYLPDMEQAIAGLEEQEAALLRMKRKRAELSEVIDQALGVNRKLDRTRPLLDLERPVIEALGYLKKQEELEAKRLPLFDLLYRIKQARREQDKLLPLQELAPVVNHAIKLQGKLSDTQSEAHRLAQTIESIQAMHRQIETAEKWHTKIHKEFHEEMGDQCILCGSVL